MVKLSDIELPVIFKKQLLFKSGDWNNWHITSDEVNKSVFNTKWNKLNKSLIYSHKDKEAESWIGKIENPTAENGNVYGDVHIYDPNTAVALKYGEAPHAISAGIAWPEQYNQPTNFFYRNFSLVADPGVRNKDIFINFQAEEKSIGGYKLATFSNEITSDSAKGSSVEQHMNTISTKDCKGKKKKENMENDDENEEDEDDESEDKDEITKESKEHPELSKDTIKQIVEDHEKNKETDMSIIEDSKQTKTMLNDVIIRKEQQIAGMADNDYKNERRSQNKIMENGIKVPSVEERLKAIEAKLANFDSEKPTESLTKTEVNKEVVNPIEPQKVVPIVQPNQQTIEPMRVVNASPMMDDKFVDTVVNKLTEKLTPALKPAPMTNNEFGGQYKSPTEETVERLANNFLKK